MSRLLWSLAAQSDLEIIDEYWSAYSEDAAEAVLTKIERAAQFLLEIPRAGPMLDRGDARKWRAAGTNYILIYRCTDTVEILRVHHMRENWREGQ
jgi:plasmid stabilization system protein ParE